MTRRIISFYDGFNGFWVTQEFNGDREEYKQFMQRDVNIPSWAEVCKLFADGLIKQGCKKTTFSKLVKQVEQQYGYKNQKLSLYAAKTGVPNVQEFWIATDNGLRLYAKNGKIVYPVTAKINVCVYSGEALMGGTIFTSHVAATDYVKKRVDDGYKVETLVLASKVDYIFFYGENEYQTYYECKVNSDDTLLIFANKGTQHSNLYMAMIQRGKECTLVYDKRYNDQQRKKIGCTGKNDVRWHTISTRALASEDIEYLKRKLIYCYEHNQNEITP